MAKVLQVLGALALVAWTAGGLFAWKAFGERLHVTLEESERAPDPEALLLRDSVSQLREDVRGLTATLERNFGALVESVEAGEAAQRAADERARAALLERLDRLEAGLRDAREATRELLRDEAARAPVMPAQAGPAPAAPAYAAEEPAPTPAEPAAAAPAAGAPVEEPAPPLPARSFLSFRLPSDDFALDERRSWTLLPGLSRVGFDARSTLHDFTGATTDVEGSLEVNLARPADGLGGRITMRVETLTTGLADRDEAMLETLDAPSSPTVVYELVGFRAGASAGEGTALGRMTIRGVTRALDVPVRWELDDAHRLSVEGEAPLSLTDYAVPVPEKLGVIKMEDEVRIWLSLRARVLPREER